MATLYGALILFSEIVPLFFLWEIFLLIIQRDWSFPRYEINRAPKWLLCILVLYIAVVPIQFFRYNDYIPEGKYSYNVILQRNDKTYTLPAEIEISYDMDEYDSYPIEYNPLTGTGYTQTHIEQVIKLNRIYWPNGGYLKFEQNDVFLSANEAVKITDQNDVDWKCTLTNERVSHPKIKEEIKGHKPIAGLSLAILGSIEWLWFMYFFLTRKKITKEEGE